MTILDTSLLPIVGTKLQRSMETSRCPSEESIWTFKDLYEEVTTYSKSVTQ